MTPFVVAVAGTSGAGKTTLIRAACQALRGRVAALHFDDYAAVSHYPPDLNAWVTAGAEPSQWRTPALVADLRALRQGKQVTPPGADRALFPAPVLLLEEPFGRARQEIAPLIDLAIYLDLPLEVALARKLMRDFRAPSARSRPAEAISQAEGFLERYVATLRDLYHAVNLIARPTCERILDGRLSTSTITTRLIEEIQASQRS